MDPILITTGLLIRTFFLTFTKFSQKDASKISLALVIGTYSAIKAESMLFFPLGFAGTIAFSYKNKIIPKVTEGTLLLYGLASLYVYYQTRNVPEGLSGIFLFFFLTFTAYSLLICFKNVRHNFLSQVLLMVAFLFMGIYIGYQSTISFLINDTSVLGQFLIGFYSLHFISSILYILNFIPLPLVRNQSYKERMHDIKKHASDLEENYIDTDVHLSQTFIIITLFILSFLYAHIFNDWITGLVLMLTIGSIATSFITTNID